MKNSKRLIVYTLAILVLTGCQTLKVAHYGPPAEKMKKVVILTTMIDRIYQPPLPLIDAGIFNGKTNDIAEEIIILQQSHVNEYRKILANSFRKHFNCQVLYGESLHSSPQFTGLVNDYDKPGELYTGNDNFPMVNISDGDINPFSFGGKRLQKFFQYEPNYRGTLGEMAQKLETDYIIVSISQLAVQRVGPFGSNGQLALHTTLYVFDDEGIMLTEVSNRSTGIFIKGKDPEQYGAVLHDFSVILEPMVQGIEARYKTNNPEASQSQGKSNPYIR